MNGAVRAGLLALGAAAASWIGVGIYRAGGDVPAPPMHADTKLTAGHAEGRRVDGKPSWSLDYERLTASPDTTLATLENVRHGTLYRRGRPFMEMRAQHVVVNTLSNDFIVTGPLVLTQREHGHIRTLTSNAANYAGILQVLTLAQPANISSDGATVKVASATVDFRSGDLKLGRILGFMPAPPR